MAEQIRFKHVSTINNSSITLIEYPPLGKEWVDNFVQRNATLQTAYARRIDASRMKETTTEAIMLWLNTTRETIKNYQTRKHG